MLGATIKKSSLSLTRHPEGEDKGLLTEEGVYQTGHHSPAWRWYYHAWLAMTAINVLLAATSIYAITTSTRCSPQTQGWDTELLDARGAIQYEERVYTGALTFDHSKGGAVRLNDGEMEFFGPPSAAIDASWEYLLHDEFPVMTEKEAEPFLPELMPLRKDHRYHFEPDMFHNLHCVNAVRLELSKTLYDSTGTPDYHHHQELPDSLTGPGWKVAHLEHCLDRLRQAVMCHGDLTPSPLYRFEGYSVALGKSGNHTCRKFETIRQWMDNRARASGL